MHVDPNAVARTKTALQTVDIIVVNLIFIEKHINAILPDLRAAGDRIDAFDAVIAGFEARGIACSPAFTGGLDGRPAISAVFKSAEGTRIDMVVSLTGFSLVGAPAYNDSDAAVAALSELDVPYIVRLEQSIQADVTA